MTRALTIAVLVFVAGCAANAPPRTAGGKAPEIVSIPSDPFPSRYKPYPGVTTVIRNAVIDDGIPDRKSVV